MTKPHKHAELIKKWADDPTQTIWFWDAPGLWLVCAGNAVWYEDYHYAVGEKPTAPPTKMCVLAGVEFPMPMTEAPENGDKYWIADIGLPEEPSYMMWGSDAQDMNWLNAGIVHKTRRAAIAHTRALIAATKQAMEAAK